MCAVPGPKSNENNWLYFWTVLVPRFGDTAFFLGKIMDIIQALQQSQEKSNKQVILDSSDYMKKEVFECCVYRLGEDVSDYKDVPPCDREETLTMLEKQKW